ncbi:glutamine-asparagine rich protein, putative [Perkinsus marinus ATCC 50983]|uniref:Glutamine-asparagine rich protein, putative n=1 Tax=Perkinsus marinus (strain ATCC 50983 / TXsc) TaxID=423536 RepID=C5LBE5_PERM5|nr:glutamine-asparagine rich protein, putative [Perkinsus marinus ATCC 50983]EER06073.1 glutamine-asparagine rich protein, putative [Perkinsus marinus ATCC 50983]|eukprot:XP_002774257.1 glutamine-asparagine rich protein, putative [Perkinsus marinus ATCC 50983]
MAVSGSSKNKKAPGDDEEEVPKLNEDLEQALDNADELDGDESTSSSSDEDSDAEMLTEDVEKKIMDTLNRIKSHDPTLKDSKEAVFKDDDFEVEGDGQKKKKSKKLTHKELMRKRLLEEGAEAAVEDEDEEKQVAQTSRQAGEDARRALMDAMGVDEDDEDNAGNDSDDDLFTVRDKTMEEKDVEDREYKKWERGQLAKAANEGNEQILMERYFRDSDEMGDNKLDDEDAFLRDYIMNKGWLEKESMQPNERDSDDSDDELDREDDFEREYNFRFEEDKGSSLVGHSRTVTDSVRVKDDKRKRKRQEKEARKAEEKAKRAEELKRLKNMKRQEIQRRLEVIAKVVSLLRYSSVCGEELLDAEWDPQAHDQLMRETVLGDGYDEQEETEESVEEKSPEESNESTAGFANDESTQWGQWDGLEAQDEAEREEQDDEHEWWLCDGCQKPVLPGKRIFQCKQCEDYVLCQPCHKNTTHRHAFVKSRVPEGCEPPEGIEQMLNKEKEEEYEMDFEDMIGDMPTRFKYRKVEAGAVHNLSVEDIIHKSDKELNQIASLKLYAPYLDEGPREPKREGSGGPVSSDHPGKGGKGGKGKGGKGGKGKGKGKGAAMASRAEAYGISKRKIQKSTNVKKR